MAGRTFLFDPPDRFVAGALGEPGSRTFYLQASKGPAVLSVALEKAHVALLAQRIGELIEDLGRRGVPEARARADAPTADPASSSSIGSGILAEPVVEAFRVGALTLAYDHERGDLTVEARELEEQSSGDLMRVRLSLAEARAFAEGAMRIVAAGRPPCPLCGEPLGPEGHVCLRRNGHVQ